MFSCWDAEETHLSSLVLCQVEVWRDVYRGLVPDGVLDDAVFLRTLSNMWQQRLKEPLRYTKIADVNGRLMGFSSVLQEKTGQGSVHALYVRSEFQGRGVGKALMDQGLSCLSGVISADVVAQNQRARAFYEKQGWVLGEAISDVKFFGCSIPMVRYIWKTSW